MIHRWRECFGLGIVFGGTGSIFAINMAIDYAIDRMRLDKSIDRMHLDRRLLLDIEDDS